MNEITKLRAQELIVLNYSIRLVFHTPYVKAKVNVFCMKKLETGIYRITNCKNGKSYVGQSKNIVARWKSHTQALNADSGETIIRMAFAKYGLRCQVSRPGIYGNFKFEILENCLQADLLERERAYIERLKPAYNCLGPNKYFVPTEQKKGTYFIQYHSLEQRGYFPNNDEEKRMTDDLDSGIYSRKRFCKDMVGAHVIMILGAKSSRSRKMTYYLWSETVIDEVIFNFEDDNYNIFGWETLLAMPIKLNRLKGFKAFIKDNGNFAFGLQSMRTNEYFQQTLLPLVKSNLLTEPMGYLAYLKRFIGQQDKSYSKYL